MHALKKAIRAFVQTHLWGFASINTASAATATKKRNMFLESFDGCKIQTSFSRGASQMSQLPSNRIATKSPTFSHALAEASSFIDASDVIYIYIYKCKCACV